MARSQHFKVGLLVIAATVILVTAVLLVTGIRLREPRDHYTIRFSESVSGLDPGSAVKYRGVRVGAVEELSIPEDDITKVEVRIGVREGTPIRTDTEAMLSHVGITGLVFVELIGGSADEPPLDVGSRIQERKSVLGALTGRAASAAEKADVLLDNLLLITNREEYERLKGGMGELRRSVYENSQRLNELLAVSTSAATRIDDLLARTDGILVRNQGHIDRSFAELEGGLRELHTALASLNEGELIDNLSATAAATRDMTGDLRTLVRSNRRSVSETLANLRETTSNLNEFSRLVKEKPSLLIRTSTPEPRRLPDSD